MDEHMASVKVGTYRHYKGKQYRVLGVARHSETLEPLVIYQALYDSEEYGPHALWARPLPMFLEQVHVDGRSLPRFTYVDDMSDYVST